ncbi:hypothetical protein RRF57_010092 [Xylaria bambusicola]|uniref:Uncharacterized protein n=1 Tax=Xylaria bambusicola TaxID=326684 RepID=A0AAN7URQ3_9PEZI
MVNSTFGVRAHGGDRYGREFVRSASHFCASAPSRVGWGSQVRQKEILPKEPRNRIARKELLLTDSGLTIPTLTLPRLDDPPAPLAARYVVANSFVQQQMLRLDSITFLDG